jgi:putative transposase
MARFEIPDGWTVQAFQFALDCTPEQAACVRRQFGGRRYARNWAVRTRGSRRYAQTQRKITRLQRRVASIRGHHLHNLNTRLAKTHGEIVVEGLDAAGMLRQKGLTGARARRRGLSDSALAETRRQLANKTSWYGSRLAIADRWYPSSNTCHACRHVQDIGWNEHWTCTGCGTSHQRDDNAAHQPRALRAARHG